MPAQPLNLPAPDSPAAPFLFSAEIIQEITDLEKRGIYTADRCPADKKRAILTLLKEGRSIREVAELVTSVKQETVKAVYDANALEVDQARRMDVKILPKARYALDLQLDRLIEHPSSVPMAAVGVLSKTLYDLTALEEGKPTERTEAHGASVNVFAQFIQLAQDLENKKQPAPGEIGAPGTGLCAGKLPVIHGQVRPAEPILEAELLDPAESPAADKQSEDPGADPEETEAQLPTLIPDPEPIPGPIPDPEPIPGPEQLELQTSGSLLGQHPGGGGGPAERPASTPTGNPSRNFPANESGESK